MISALCASRFSGSDGRHPRRQGKGDGTTEESTSLADTPDSATQAAWVKHLKERGWVCINSSQLKVTEIFMDFLGDPGSKFAKDMANLD